MRYAILLAPLLFSCSRITEPPVIKQSQEFTIQDGAGFNYRLQVEGSHVPGLLYGSWTSQGVGQHKGDAVHKFTLLSPSNEVITKLENVGTGNFQIHVKEPGVYTFHYDPPPILKLGDRKVVIEYSLKRD